MGDSLFTMRTEVYELLLANPQVVAGRGRTPIFSGNVGHCAEGTRNGVPGIMIRNGWWFDDLTREWTQLARPPVPSSIGTYTLHTYRGQPTIFGVTECFTNTDVSFLFLIEQKWGGECICMLSISLQGDTIGCQSGTGVLRVWNVKISLY